MKEHSTAPRRTTDRSTSPTAAKMVVFAGTGGRQRRSSPTSKAASLSRAATGSRTVRHTVTTNSSRASSWWADVKASAPSPRRPQALSSMARHSWLGQILVGDDPEALRLFDEAFLGSWESVADFANQLMGELGPLSADASEEDQQFHMLLLANELAEELQQRGVICAIPNNRDGVWVFRPPEKRAPQDRTGVTKGGEHA